RRGRGRCGLAHPAGPGRSRPARGGAARQHRPGDARRRLAGAAGARPAGAHRGPGRPGARGQPGPRRPAGDGPGGAHPADRLAARAVSVDLAVIGGGMAGLVTAHTAVRAGADVVLLEAGPVVGGLVRAHQVAGIALDAGAESFATRGGHVGALAEELDLPGLTPRPAPARGPHPGRRPPPPAPGARVGPPAAALALPVLTPRPAPARVLPSGRLPPLPATGVLGIPTDLDAPGLLEVLGPAGLDRAREDLSRPVQPSTAEPTLAELVTSRMGRAVLDALVRPIVRGVHSAEPEQIAADVLLPGITAKMQAAGSLTGALRQVRAAAPAGSAVAGIDGGVHRLPAALAADLTARGATVRTS